MRNGLDRALLLFIAIAGCGGTGVNVPRGPMPSGGSWTGVYYSPQYGEMHMVQNGPGVVGEYKKDERIGKLQGEADGNYMHFEWEEDRMSISNRASVSRGHGFFLYKIDPANGDHVLTGRWGMEDDDSEGGEWNAYKAKNKEPEIGGGSQGGEDEDDDSLEEDTSEDEGDDDLF